MTTLAPGIDAVNMTAESALREYGVLTLRSELVARALLENRAVRYQSRRTDLREKKPPPRR